MLPTQFFPGSDAIWKGTGPPPPWRPHAPDPPASDCNGTVGRQRFRKPRHPGFLLPHPPGEGGTRSDRGGAAGPTCVPLPLCFVSLYEIWQFFEKNKLRHFRSDPNSVQFLCNLSVFFKKRKPCIFAPTPIFVRLCVIWHVF